MGFNFSKLGDTFLKIGQSTLQTGAFLATTKAMNSPCNMNNSVFGCGSFGGYSGFGGGFSGMSYGCGMGDMYSQMGMMDPYASQMAIGQAYGRGYALGEYLKSQPSPFQGISSMTGLTGLQQQHALTPTDNKAAEKFKDQDTKLGEAFEKHTKEGKETDFVTSDWKKEAEGKEKDDKYKAFTSNFAKSYIAHIDKKSGNQDNEIALDEFINYNLSLESKENATAEEKAAYKQAAKTAFNKMDQNGDGKVDWKEMAAVMSTYDSLKDGKHDGTITKEEIDDGSKLLSNNSGTDIDMKFRAEYKRLFGGDEK